MKKKKILILVIAILVVIGIIIAITKIIGDKKNKEQLLSKIYNNLNTNQTYLFEMEQNEDNKTIMAKKDNKTIIDQKTKDNHTTTLVKDNNTYLVLHDRQEYYVYEQNNVEQSILTDGLKEVIDKPFIKGSEKIINKKYDYEEYNGSTIFMISNSLNIDDSQVKTRFYFDKDDNLVYIKTIYGENNELLKINLKQEVDDSLFEIPENYAEN